MTYPLEAARVVRENAAAEAERALADALAALESARAARAQTQERLRAHRARPRREEHRFETAAQLRREQDHAAALQAQERALTSALTDAIATEHRASAEVARARAHLAKATADHGVVEKHRERWQRGADQKAERRAEEELEEIAAPRRNSGA